MTRLAPFDTPRLLIRELRDEDLNDIHEIKSDPEVVRYLNWGPNEHPGQTRTNLRAQIALQKIVNRTVFVLAIEERESGRVIGNATIVFQNGAKKVADIGYFLGPASWGRGYGTEVTAAVRDLAFTRLNALRLEALCDVRNEASIRCLKQAGFIIEGRKRRNQQVQGEWRDHYVFGMLREDDHPVMNGEALKDELEQLELKLQSPEVRTDAGEIERLLHDDFFEFGSSGVAFTKADCLDPAGIGVRDFRMSDLECRQLSPDTALVTYRVYDATRDHRTLRSSVWKKADGRWQMYFHQGTIVK
ncbi:GNAT family N-acetyltransferase [Alteribacter natronophilus]|uniref:GNAT family N-acetyltransferase n=1 Tax=Alteribacter natronophilus TaxID=2583810 RepID=UPI00110DAD4F|nr:GNAT family N-acetyltransferase [Alteribacter natronophilus]TMW70737.1 GNAT family N-acetyltransferase [Alteribacter natronophilus]